MPGIKRMKKASSSETKHPQVAMYGMKKNKSKKAKGGMRYKAKKGSKLGMVSVETGFDNNPEVTRADVIQAAKKKKGQAKGGMKMKAKKAENGMKTIERKKKNPITGGTKRKTITRNPDGSTTRSKVKRNRFGEVTKQKTKTTGAGTTKTKKKFTKASGATVTSKKPRRTVKSIARGVAAIPKVYGTIGASLPGFALALPAKGAGRVFKDTKVGRKIDKFGDKMVDMTTDAMDYNTRSFSDNDNTSPFNVKGSKFRDVDRSKGNTFMMGGKIAKDNNYDMLNKQSS